jgi:hypothetical protein
MKNIMVELFFLSILIPVFIKVIYIEYKYNKKKQSKEFINYLQEILQEYTNYKRKNYMDYDIIAVKEFEKYGYLKKPLKLENYLPENFYQNLKEYLEL